jgi:transcriptional regulator with XRE-family HTH domain
MMNTSSSLVGELREKEYRDAYVEAQIRMTLPLQIRELRKRREWTQPQLAERARMGQPRISELEKPGERRLTIETLLRLASAFDVGLQVRFVPFGELIEWGEDLDVDNFDVLPFEKELAESVRNAGVQSIPKKPPKAAAAAAGACQAAGSSIENLQQSRSATMPLTVIEGGREQYGNHGDLNVTGASLYRNG